MNFWTFFFFRQFVIVYNNFAFHDEPLFFDAPRTRPVPSTPPLQTASLCLERLGSYEFLKWKRKGRGFFLTQVATRFYFFAAKRRVGARRRSCAFRQYRGRRVERRRRRAFSVNNFGGAEFV